MTGWRCSTRPSAESPYVSRIDAGTVELVRSTGVEVIPSADLIQLFEAVLTAQQAEQQRETARALTEIVNDTFQETAEKIQSGRSLLEYEVQQSILSLLRIAVWSGTMHPSWP